MIASAITVEKATAFSFHIGIKKKLITIFAIALITVAAKTTFSFLAGIKTHWLKIQPNMQNIRAMLNRRSELTALI